MHSIHCAQSCPYLQDYTMHKLKKQAQNIILGFVDCASLYNLVNKANFVHNINCAQSWLYLQDYTMYKFISAV